MKRFRAKYLFLVACIFVFLCCKKNTNNTTTGEGKVASNLTVGNTGWTNDYCSLITNTLSSYKGTMTVQIITHLPNFNEGTYAITGGIPTAGQINLRILNPSGYLQGSKFYGTNGSLIITQTTPLIVATFSNITCKEQPSSSLQINVSGTLTCL